MELTQEQKEKLEKGKRFLACTKCDNFRIEKFFGQEYVACNMIPSNCVLNKRILAEMDK